MPGLGSKSDTAFAIGTLASRPMATPYKEGNRYYATDVNQGTLYLCDGTTWIQATAGQKSIVAGSNVTIVNTPTTITVNSSNAFYTLPIASASVLGGIKVGTQLFMSADGTLSSTYIFPIASASVLGGIKVGANLSIDGSGVLSGAAQYSLPNASASVLGGIKVGAGLAIDGTGVLSTGTFTDQVNVVMYQNGAILSSGVVADLYFPFSCNIVAVDLLADTTTNAVVDIRKKQYTAYPPGGGDSITASATPTLSSAVKYQDTTLTGWNNAISVGDVLEVNINNCSAATKMTLGIKLLRAFFDGG